MMKKAIASVLGAVVLMPVVAGVAQARPEDVRVGGSANQSNCKVTSTRDLGFYTTIQYTTPSGEVRVKTVRDSQLRFYDNYIVLTRVDRGLIVNKTGSYQKLCRLVSGVGRSRSSFPLTTA